MHPLWNSEDTEASELNEGWIWPLAAFASLMNAFVCGSPV
jgi:hypothetical protein